MIEFSKEKLDHHVRIAWMKAIANFDDDRIPPLIKDFTHDNNKLVVSTANKMLNHTSDKLYLYH